MEKEITKIWCRILEIDRIEPDENFFDLGGNSITAMMILEDVNNKFNVGLVSTDLYSNDTVRKMTVTVAERLKDTGKKRIKC
ncbi:acyl carrier protein [Pseudoramibacter alactolyticus]|jgi:acyl carrier protein|uniref:acyl carrier protein n=1 Tax=Pseudoramibacter alactolyticus TaxID=113287 RepID=UPI002356E8A4|nr:acyl carrier protein [Pseudoramibacter alactolyticus]MBM6968123.1 acyl carrier protein [Pseudoramibacter alactolyticus]